MPQKPKRATTRATGAAMSVASVMVRAPVTIAAGRSMAAAHRLMSRHRIRHLPVLRDGALVGIVSMRDLHLVETLKDVDPETVSVAEAMTPEPYQVSPAAPLVAVARTMAERKLGSVVVVEAGAVVGLFTTVDAMSLLADLLEGARPSRAARWLRARS